jgi:hypothetical protein
LLAAHAKLWVSAAATCCQSLALCSFDCCEYRLLRRLPLPLLPVVPLLLLLLLLVVLLVPVDVAELELEV